MNKSKALVLLSGGQDSTTCLFWAKENFAEVLALNIGYGQRHAIERQAAEQIAKLAGVRYEEINTGLFQRIGNSALLEKGDISASHKSASDLPASFVPGRNIIFLTIAAMYAYKHDIINIVTGVTTSDFWEFPKINWRWLAGFWEAEGCFSRGYYLNASEKVFIPSISISQNDFSIINQIKIFIDNELGITSHICNSKTKNGINYELQISYKKNVAPFINSLSRYMHCQHKRKQMKNMCLEFNIPFYDTDFEMDWEWVTGFWEGDGGIFKSNHIWKGTKTFYPEYNFYQNNENILARIKAFLGKGHIYEDNKKNFVLTTSDGNISPTIYPNLYHRIKIKSKKEKISRIYVDLQRSENHFESSYPDCTPEFIYWMNKSIKTAINRKLQIHTPLAYLTKAESINLAQALPGCIEALAWSHTCYEGEIPPCGECPACILRAKGFREAGIIDPLIERITNA